MKRTWNISPVVAVATVASMLLLNACSSSSFEHWRSPELQSQNGDRPLRVIVLPAEDASGGLGFFEVIARPFVWIAQLITFSPPENPPPSSVVAESLRPLLLALLDTSSIEVLNPLDLQEAVKKVGLEGAAHGIPAPILGELVNADAVLKTTLHAISAHYYVLESSEVVDCSLELRSCRDDQILYWGRASVSNQAGISGVPAGLTSLAAEPLAALGGASYQALTVYCLKQLCDGLWGTRTEALEEQVAMPPSIEWIALPDSCHGIWKAGDQLSFVGLATRGCTAFLRIDGITDKLPMLEVPSGPQGGSTPGKFALYATHYIVQPHQKVARGRVRMVLNRADGGRVARTAPDVLTIE